MWGARSPRCGRRAIRRGPARSRRTYLAEFNASTGALVTSFTPTLDGQVTALAVSPDGSTLYVGGSFSHVNGSFRNHLAALSTSTGALSTTWAPNAGNSVTSIALSPDGSDVYIGGTFVKLDGVARTYAGEVSSAAGALLPWAPNLTGTVTSVAVAPDDSRVMVGGYFTQFNGAAQQGVVDVDATTGSTNNLTSIEPHFSGCTATVKDIVIGSVTAGTRPASPTSPRRAPAAAASTATGRPTSAPARWSGRITAWARPRRW